MMFFLNFLLSFIFITATVLFVDCEKEFENSKKSITVYGPENVKQGAFSALDKIKNSNVKLESELKEDKYGKLNSKGDSNQLGFTHAFAATMSFIVISELGDKTFFIAAIMAMRHSRLTVFSGALGALAAMTVLSALLGFATTVVPRLLTYYVSAGLFAIFGIKMLYEAGQMNSESGLKEYEETQAELRKREESEFVLGAKDEETGVIGATIPPLSVVKRLGKALCSKTLLEAFMLTFLAEWGDRSQITTIILASRENVIGVVFGGTLGHAVCTGLAVLGGRFVAQRISVRTVTFIGGILFLLFALSAFFIGPDSNS